MHNFLKLNAELCSYSPMHYCISKSSAYERALKLVQSTVQAGVKPETPAGKKTVLNLVNLLSLITGTITLPYIGIYYWVGYPLMSRLVVPFTLGCFLVPVLNKIGFTNFSRILFILTGNFAVMIFTLAFGKESGIYICYLNLITYPFLAFQLQEKRHLIFGLSLPLFLYSLHVWKFFNEDPWISLDQFKLGIIQICIMLSCFVTLSSAFLFFTFENMKAKMRLEASVLSLQAAKEKTEEANRAKDAFLATLSHELRTPLTTILCWAEMLLNGNPNAEKTKHGIAVIEKNANAQAKLINDLLDISRIQSGKLYLAPQEFDPAVTMQMVVESVRSLAENKSIQIYVDKPLPYVRIIADPLRVQQVFWNLLTNAIKFTPTHGTIEIRYSFLTENSVQKFRIQFCDSGIGIEPSFLSRIFERFSQVDNSSTRSYGGLGLGLAIVRSLVEMQGGAISADSAGKNKGTTFTLDFPLKMPAMTTSQGEKFQLSVETSDQRPVRLDGLRILSVEDNESMREAIFILLLSLGAEVRSVTSVQEALEALRTFHPDVLLSDIAMPEENGFSLIRRIRADEKKSGKKLPALAVTAYASAGDIQSILASGFNGHIKKPFDANQLSRDILRLAQA